MTPVADPAAVYQVNRMLVQVMERGTGAPRERSCRRAWSSPERSGTSSDYRDSWFAGFSGNHLAVVWIGYDDDSPTGLTGSSGSLAVWSRLMALARNNFLERPVARGTQEVLIEYPTGLQAKPDCGEEVISVAVPQNVHLPFVPGCEVGVFDELGERAREWWRGITR